MRKIRFMLFMTMIMCLFVCGCSAPKTDDGPEESDAPEETLDTKIHEIMDEMSVEQKLAQMIIITLRSDTNNTKTPTEINDDYRSILEKYDFSGVILMAGNLESSTQTVKMIRDCQEAAVNGGAAIPMFMCLDEEGGMVNRVGFGTTGPGNMALAAAGDTALIEECADLLGQEIAALGFNMDFAPVSDVNSNPANPVIGVRSFSDDPAVVSEHVTAFIKGLRKNGICTALKHFPGHGNVGEDSHTHLPCSDFSLEDIKNCDLIPFAAGIKENAEMIMTAHIQYPQIETETYVSKLDGEEVSLPATLSRKIIHDLLREDMGYEGVVITDAMVMDAIASHFDPLDAAVLAINAGVDILLAPLDVYKDDEIDTFPAMEAYMEGLKERVENGEINAEEIDDSVYRILKLKMESGIFENAVSGNVDEMAAKAEDIVGTSAHHAREWEMTQLGLTLLKNENEALPVEGTDGSKTLVLYPSERRKPAIDYAIARMEKKGMLDAANVTCLNYAEIAADDEQFVNALAEASHIFVLSVSTDSYELIEDVIAQAHTDGKTVSLISLNLPYDAAVYEDIDAVLCAYNPYGSAHDEEGNGPFNLNVAVGLCAAFGECVPQGKLPVNVPKIADGAFTEEYLYERGYGLMNWGKE